MESLSKEQVAIIIADVCSYIDGLKCDMLAASGNIPCNGGKSATGSDSEILYGADNTQAAAMVLFSNRENRNMDVLIEKITRFKNAVISLPESDHNIKELTATLLFVSEGTEGSEQPIRNTDNSRWEQAEFPNTYLIAVINALTRIQANIRLIEAELIKKGVNKQSL